MAQQMCLKERGDEHKKELELTMSIGFSSVANFINVPWLLIAMPAIGPDG